MLKSNGKKVFEAIKSTFATYRLIEMNTAVDEIDRFVGNLMVAPGKELGSMQLVEAIVSGTENKGIIAIWIYGDNKEEIDSKLKTEILPKISQLAEGVKEGPELNQMYCSGNCGEMLNLDDMDERGIS